MIARGAVLAVTAAWALVIIIAIIAGRAWERQARVGQPVPEPDLLAEHAELLASLCGLCQGGNGTCICTAPCKGLLGCMGGFTAQDVAFLRALTMPAEGTDQ